MNLLISSEWYKLRRSRVLAVALLLCAVLLGLTAQGNAITGETVFGGEAIAALGANSAFWQIAMLAVIGFFCASDFVTGTIRNPIGIGKSRPGIYASRLFSAFAITFAIMAFVALLSTAVCTLAFGFGAMGFGEFAVSFGMTLAKQTLYHWALASAFLMFAFLSRSPAMTILCGFCYMIFLLFLPSVLSVVGAGFLWLVDYIPDTHISAVGAPHENAALAFAVALGHIAVTSAVGCIVFSKQDIK
jgi:ABC-type transport system involved in multi-copper enzyme maturation permease subunit